MSLRDDARWLRDWSLDIPVEPKQYNEFMAVVSRVCAALLIYLGQETTPEQAEAKAREMDEWDEFFADPVFRGMLGSTDHIVNPDHPDNRGE